jgi:cholesterol transport system auxiliary component
MRLRHLLVFSAAAILSSCSIGRPMPTVTTYSIEPSPATPDALRPLRTERLRVERVRVAAAYDSGALVYRLSAVRYVSDPYHAFLTEPGPMLTNGIAKWLAAAELFKAVDGPGSAAPAPWALETTVTELYGDFEAGSEKSSAVMAIRFTIIDEGSARPRVAFERSLSRRVPIRRADPEALVAGYGAALADILTQLATELSQSTLR